MYIFNEVHSNYLNELLLLTDIVIISVPVKSKSFIF